MYGHPQPFRPGGGGGRGVVQPPQQQQIHLNPNFFPNPNHFHLQQNPSFLPNFNPFLQNPNSFPQNQQPFINSSYPFQPNFDSNNLETPSPYGNNRTSFPFQPVKVQKEMVDKVDKAVVKARTELLESNENVSAWKVSQAALLTVKAESWESLGFQMQQVPSLNNLLVIEGKINAFIHCFVAVRRITSLYDLEVAICENEGIQQFEELGLGPLVRHPLVVHYFSVTSDVIEVYRITTEEIISYLSEFIDTHKKKDIKVETVLDFICEKKSVSGRQKLCVRAQNFGVYINHIKKARQSEDRVLEKCYEKMRMRSDKRKKKRPLFSAQKKEMDEHFTEISQRIKSFSSSNTQFCGKHIRFVSSSSDDDSESSEHDENHDEKNTGSNCSLPLPNGRSDRVSSCPYPSATEERTRLGFKSEREPESCTPGGGVRCNGDNEFPKRKRKYDNMSSSTSLNRNMRKRDVFDANLKQTSSDSQGISGHSVSAESLRMFVTTWKQTCRENNAHEVLQRMLQFYNARRRRKLRESFKFFPCVGLLYVAVTCIKSGMWDNMYDTFQNFDEKDVDDKPSESSDEYISINVETTEKDVAVPPPKILTHHHGVGAEDIAKKISGYFEDDMLSYKTPYRENILHFLRKLCKCEYWLIEQFSINKFESLGYGEYLMFLEKYTHLLPHALQKFFVGDKSQNVSLEAHLLPTQLDVLLSQASNSLSENEEMNMQNVSELLARQFPLVSIKLVNNDPTAKFTKTCSIISNSLLFSTPLSRLNYMGNSSTRNEKSMEETKGFANDGVAIEGMIGSVTTRDAIEILLKAPMMIDLNLWSHWDKLFAPSLGSIVEWLLKEVNTKELLCLITKDGKVIRIDHSATTDSFLKVFIRGSSFETAVQLLSLFALYGGERSAPLSLLKCHARQAFEVIINNYLEKELHNNMNLVGHRIPSSDKLIVGKNISGGLASKLPYNRIVLKKAAPVMARFILDCLSYLPIEFCSFAADVLIAGLQSFLNDVPAAILTECKEIEQRLMLHDVGISLGLLEWVHDYQSFCSSPSTEFSLGSSCLNVVDSEPSTRSVTGQGDKHPVSLGEKLVSCEVDHHDLRSKRDGVGSDSAEISVNCQTANSKVIYTPSNYNPAKVIESIRQEEFGLDQSLSATENSMLERQHARLGRALHCLSHELYSQDSHFLLELVQNADDNIYLECVEPTLTFILHDKGIVVLNNEVGFSANNIRALCDVGNSTKIGRNAGYIGKKGIGFKSVFRVTDAPEIHSNGFHIKFDITEGQIGFVLPTVVPPCDVDLYTRLASGNADSQDQNSWNTCIVLPFRSDVLEGYAMNNILSMFTDLDSSLLLFLHRLQCVKFRNLLDDSLTVMRKEIIGGGIVEVTYRNKKMTWFVVSQELNADVIRSDVRTTEISVAFALQGTSEAGYDPILKQQPVFAFLPLRTYGLKFILQGDFVLPSSREEVDGNSPWNQWLLTEFPNLFVTAERSFCALPCYRGRPGKAVTVFMSFIPLVGEVHGFFSSLPRAIIHKLSLSNCLIQEGDGIEWVAPGKVLRKWTDQARSLIPDSLLHEHLDLCFLNKDIVLSDSLANALGVEDYGPQFLLRFLSTLCGSHNGLQSMGLSWLSSWLSTFYVMSSQFLMRTPLSSMTESTLLDELRKIPFVPLSDGKYSSLNEDTIWLHEEVVVQDISDECLLRAFPKLYEKLRLVSPKLLAAAASIESPCSGSSIIENVKRMLYNVGVQRLSVHDIVKVHILPALSEGKNATGQEELMIEYLAFVMYHLQSTCMACSLERGGIIAELHEKAQILTNYGFKRSSELPIHFNQDFGNPVDVNRLISGLDIIWHEIDIAYVKHPITKSIPGGVLKWRSFFKELGVTDFVRVVEVKKSVCDVNSANSEDVVGIKDVIPTDSVARNWESCELLHLLSRISSTDVGEKCKYLLEILDRLWDDNFSDKVAGYLIGSSEECKPFKSSFITILQEFPWIVSNIDNKLHYPKELFHDCLAVNSVLGVSAPYSIPKVNSEKMLADIGLKTQVTLDDALSVLRLWRKLESPFRASVSQMSNFYSFLWRGMALSKNKIIEELHSGPFIFVPNTSSCSEEDLVHGALLSPQEVYWHDTIGKISQIKQVHPVCVSSTGSHAQRKMLYNFYPNLHDFFVNECGVDECPPFCSYLQILLQLSTIALPHQAAKRVFEVFIMWDDALKSGSLSSEDVKYLKESLLKKEYTVLPTRQDKWVSLHTSFGLLCWCDDHSLGKEFRNLEGVDFLHFGESTDEENQMLQSKVSNIMRRLGIPALSEIVTREAIYYGPADCTFIYSLVNWVLPYAQRYIYNAHPDTYSQLKQSSFENLTNLKIVVVEKLFYRNVIKNKSEITSKKRHQCNCLLKNNILYCSRESSDPHSIFLELSCFLFNGTPDLHFANFLHMITTMAESGSTEEQTEFFILNSQKVRKLPAEESAWSLQPVENKAAILLESSLSQNVEEQSSSVIKRRSGVYSSSNWPPADWRTAPGFSSSSSFGLKKFEEGIFAEKYFEQADISIAGFNSEFNIEVDTRRITQEAVLLEPDIPLTQSNNSDRLVASSMKPNPDFSLLPHCAVGSSRTEKDCSSFIALDSVDLGAPSSMNFVPSNYSDRDEVFAQQALLTGRLGELVAYKYFVAKEGNDTCVNWVNETNETGLPYDIVLGDDEDSKEYIEVKATKSVRKNWFLISMREWQFAIEKGESFSIAHVVLADNNMARVSVYKNPARLCQLGNLKLAFVVPKQ